MKLDWDVVLPIWLSFVWRAVLYGFLGGAVAGFIAGIVATSIGQGAYGASWGAGAGMAAGWIASLPALKHGLQKHLHRLTTANVPALSQ
jgi:hypothetical protein